MCNISDLSKLRQIRRIKNNRFPLSAHRVLKSFLHRECTNFAFAIYGNQTDLKSSSPFVFGNNAAAPISLSTHIYHLETRRFKMIDVSRTVF